MLSSLLLIACTPRASDILPTPTPARLTGGEPDRFGVPEDRPASLSWTAVGSFPTVDGRTEALTVTVDEDTTSFFANVLGTPGTTVSVAYAEAPSGTVLIDADLDLADLDPTEMAVALVVSGGQPGLFLSPNRAFPSEGRNATMFPNNPSVQIEPGEWIFEFQTTVGFAEPIDSEVEVGILQRKLTPSDSNTLGIALHLGPTAPSAAAAPDHPSIQSMVDRIDEMLGQAGITLGAVEYIDAPDLIEVVDLSEGCLLGPEVREASQSLAPASPGSVNIAVVESFSCDGTPMGAGLVGLTGGIPGIPWSQTDAVFIGTEVMEEFPDVWPRIAAHELGHFLGLFHTREGTTNVGDQLDDTDFSTENMMYPQVDMAALVTPDQSWVLQRSPWVAPE